MLKHVEHTCYATAVYSGMPKNNNNIKKMF